jgi:hypothetical protein
MDIECESEEWAAADKVADAVTESLRNDTISDEDGDEVERPMAEADARMTEEELAAAIMRPMSDEEIAAGIAEMDEIVRRSLDVTDGQ